MKKTYGIYNLSPEQMLYLTNKYNDRYGGFGAFIGMISNQSVEYSRDFGETLKENIDRMIELEATIKDFEEDRTTKTVTPVVKSVIVQPTGTMPSF